ncbi:MAG: metallopeptidase TldD-related protein, partial [Deltaproteobacteria bacterium]
MIITRELISERAAAIIRLDQADGVEVVVNGRRASTLRFANSVFHQGGVSLDSSVSIRVICGKRVGVASTNTLEFAALKECLSRAVAIAGHVREEPFEVRLPCVGEYSDVVSYFESTVSATEEDIAQSLSEGFRGAALNGVLQSGSFTTEAGGVGVFNSNGVSAYHPYTSAHLSVVSTKDDVSGFKSALSNDISAIDIKGVMGDSAGRALSAVSPRAITPGAFRVLLEPPAVAELIYWLSYTGFGARGFSEGTSFLSGRLGERVTGEGVT